MKTLSVVAGIMLFAASAAGAQGEPATQIMLRPKLSIAGGGPICLDQDQIEQLEVRKGPKAAAQFGNRPGQGVIIITTRGDRSPFGRCVRGDTLEILTAAPGGSDPLSQFMFPPDLVMAHQQAIGLTDRQRAAIQSAAKDAQAKFVDLQFKMSGEVEKLQSLLNNTTVDESKVLDQIDRVLAGEREIKRAQLSLMIRIKNQLTEQQQTLLRKIRADG